MDSNISNTGLMERAKSFFGFRSEPVIRESIKPETPKAYHVGEGFGGVHPSFLSDGSKMIRGISGSGQPVTISHYATRMNARKAYQETPQARSIVDRMADSVADTGLRLEATPKASVLGISEEEADEWGRDVEPKFDAYARSKKQNRSETMNLYQHQRLYQIYQHRDNDNFTRLYYSDDPDLLSPLQFEFIDTNQIRGYSFTSTYGINGHDDGIKRDDRGREIEYKIWIRKGIGQFEDVKIPAKSKDGKRRFMLHGYVPEYAGQGRGYSRLAHALQEFQQITDFSMASIQKAINQAMFVAAVKPSTDEDSTDFMEEVRTSVGIGPAASQIGSTPSPSAEAENVTAESLQPVTCSVVDEYTLRQPGLVVTNLTRGSELKMLENKAPADSFDGFVDAFTSYLAASHSMPLEVLLMKFNQNFSASRAALLLFWRVVQIWRDEMAADFLNPIYEMWLSEEIAAGRINAPGWSDPRLRAAWMSNAWIGSPAPDIDPSKTAKATTENIKNGLITGKRAARNLNGSDHANNMTTLEREFGSRPIAPWLSPPVAETETEENPKDKEDEEE
jgi:lambda family phage portal protein